MPPNLEKRDSLSESLDSFWRSLARLGNGKQRLELLPNRVGQHLESLRI
ncbi:hypothetical protein [Laspinema olomoucense]|nr:MULTISPECIES: hypothetical protein [unclassified Laspinema]MCT7970950.1 hypothetical protein [Laspinema sp. D3d]MCT7989980.1 hypothetical protein [Laspinema sp. D3a]